MGDPTKPTRISLCCVDPRFKDVHHQFIAMRDEDTGISAYDFRWPGASLCFVLDNPHNVLLSQALLDRMVLVCGDVKTEIDLINHWDCAAYVETGLDGKDRSRHTEDLKLAAEKLPQLLNEKRERDGKKPLTKITVNRFFAATPHGPVANFGPS